MKRSVCSQLMFVILFVLQTQQLHIVNNNKNNLVQAQEYSVEERIYIVKSLVKEQALPQSVEDNQLNEAQLQRQQFIQQQQPQHQQHPNQQHQNLHSHNNNHQQQNPPHQEQLYQHPQQLQPQPQQLFQLQQEQHHQPLQQQRENIHHDEQQQHEHQTIASSMQQVLLDSSGQQYLYAHTQIEWKRGHTQRSEVSAEFYADNYESSFPVTTQDQLAYFQYHHLQQQQYHHHQYHHHHQSHLMYSGQINDDDHDDGILMNRPTGSCDSQNPSILMRPNLEEAQTCEAKQNDPTAESSRNVPSFSHKPSHNSNIESYPLAPHHYHYESSLMSAIKHYWREVSGLCLASAIFLNWLFVFVKRKLVASGLTRSEQAIEAIHLPASRSVSKDTNSSSAHDSAFEETASPISLEDIELSKSSSEHRDKSTSSVQVLNTSVPITRQRSSTLKAEPIPIPASPGHNSQSTSLSNSLNTFEYSSRYSSDFDSIQRLGRGGFGIVFEARNKIDDCHYAVKRICLPLEKEARERVMREVRALAKLDHAGIVRYYNAWLETPPDEWLKQHDAQLGIVHSKEGLSFPSTDGIYEKNESENVTKAGKESGDNSSGLFGSSPFKRRANGFRRFLKNNSSSPSLDIVFEGSGSIRLESQNNTEKTYSSDDEGTGPEDSDIKKGSKNGDINSDSEDSDFIQFESKGKKMSANGKLNGGEVSISGHLTEPFSSSDSEDEDLENKRVRQVDLERKKALKRQKEMKQLNNASLVENLHVEKVYLYIQMQLCRKDTLKDWLKTNCEHRDKTTIFDLFYQIVDAVEYVHSQDLIHRDLKPSNIFFSLDGTLKIGDFGLCRAKTSAGIGSSLDLQEFVAESDVERSFEAVHTEQVGTQLYMSPEQLNGLSYNQKVDIFAMGLILLELLIPFKTQMQRVNVLFKARNHLYSDEFRSDHPKEHELVKSLLSRSPLKRPTATEIKQHELLASAQLSQPVIERIYHRRRTISSNSSND